LLRKIVDRLFVNGHDVVAIVLHGDFGVLIGGMVLRVMWRVP